MTSRAHPTGPGLTGPLCFLAAAGAAALTTVSAWIAAHGATGRDAEHAPIPGVGPGLLLTLLLRGPAPLIGPHGSTAVFWALFTALLALFAALAAYPVLRVVRVLARAGTPAAAMGQPRDYRDMSGRRAVERARSLRPDYTGPLDDGEIGLVLGRLAGTSTRVIASHEDVGTVVCGPRSNKTSAIVVPAILTTPGPLIATSNKPDIWTLTSGARARLGRVFALDPQGIAGVDQDWWIDLLAELHDMSDANELAEHFTSTVTSEHDNNPYFSKGAKRLLAQLFLAAAHSPDHSLISVQGWLQERDDQPVGLLRDAGFDGVAGALEGTIAAPPDQKGGLYETALTAISCLESRAILRYVTPPATWRGAHRRATVITQFDPWRFLVGYDPRGPHDSIYLLTREGAGNAAPVVAAIVDRLFKTATHAAAARGGRVEPPVRAVLDEAANICPIANLPDLYSYFGSMSVQVITILQSYQQAVGIWGHSGAAKLWSASTWRLIGAGGSDRGFLEDASTLIGPYEVGTRSDQRSGGLLGGGAGGSSSTWSSRSEPIMTAADIAALTKTEAVLYVTGHRPARLDLLPWYAENDTHDITTYREHAEHELRQAAIEALGPTNPVALALQTQVRRRP